METSTAYAESKLHDGDVAFAVARRWPDVLSNRAGEPGAGTRPRWDGGLVRPTDMDQANLTQAGSPAATNGKPR